MALPVEWKLEAPLGAVSAAVALVPVLERPAVLLALLALVVLPVEQVPPAALVRQVPQAVRLAEL